MKMIAAILLSVCTFNAGARDHINVQVAIPGVYVGYSNGYGYHGGNRVNVVVEPVRYGRGYYERSYRDNGAYVVRDIRPVIYNRYPSGYNYTGQPTFRDYP